MSSFGGGQKSDATYARYNNEGILLARQFIKESDRADLGSMSQEDISVAACRWMLSQHNRWSADHVRLKCAVFTQRIETFAATGMISDSEAENLLEALRNERPKPLVKGGPHHPDRREWPRSRRHRRNYHRRRLPGKIYRAASGVDRRHLTLVQTFRREQGPPSGDARADTTRMRRSFKNSSSYALCIEAFRYRVLQKIWVEPRGNSCSGQSCFRPHRRRAVRQGEERYQAAAQTFPGRSRTGRAGPPFSEKICAPCGAR